MDLMSDTLHYKSVFHGQSDYLVSMKQAIQLNVYSIDLSGESELNFPQQIVLLVFLEKHW